MSFFKSEIVQEEIENISKLGTAISENVLLFPTLSDSEKSKRVDILQEMLDKLRLFYTRLSLSEDEEAKEMKERINDCAILMGAESEGNINEAFDNIQYLIDRMRKELDNQGPKVLER